MQISVVVKDARAYLERKEWGTALGIAGLIFLTLMTAGAVLLVAGKLQFPSLGSGAGPVDILRAIGLVALACLGATVDLDGVPLSVIPLGALGLVAWSSTRLAREAFRGRPTWAALDVFKVGAALAAITSLASLLFRMGGSVPVTTSPWETMGLGFIWGSALASLGALSARPGALKGRLRWGSGEAVVAGLRSGAHAAILALAGSSIALLCLIIGRLALYPLPSWFGAGEAVAAVIYLVAFLPNAVVALFSLAVGATLTVGAQLVVGGDAVGPLREHSLFEWGGGNPPPALLLLLAVPLLVSVTTGMIAAERDRNVRSLLVTIAMSAGVVALGVGLLAIVGDARLGAGLVEQRGLGLVAVDAGQAGLFTFLWLCAGGATGAALHIRLQGRRRGKT